MSAARFRVEVDRERCIGAAVCTFHAPASFDVGDDAKVRWIEGGGDSLEAIRNAVESCPTRALKLVEEKEAAR